MGRARGQLNASAASRFIPFRKTRDIRTSVPEVADKLLASLQLDQLFLLIYSGAASYDLDVKLVPSTDINPRGEDVVVRAVIPNPTLTRITTNAHLQEATEADFEGELIRIPARLFADRNAMYDAYKPEIEVRNERGGRDKETREREQRQTLAFITSHRGTPA